MISLIDVQRLGTTRQLEKQHTSTSRSQEDGSRSRQLWSYIACAFLKIVHTCIMASSGSTPDSSSSSPDDINDLLAELATEGKFRAPSAAERARASGRPPGGGVTPKRRRGGPFRRWRNKRLAAELRKPVLPSGQKASARPPKARARHADTWPAPGRSYAAPTRRRGSGRSALVVVIVLAIALLVAVYFGPRKMFSTGTPGTPGTSGTATSPASSPPPLFRTADPFARSPAAAYADGAAGIVLPAAHPVGQYTGAQVAAAYATVKDMLVAALLNRPTMYRHKPVALGHLLISQQRSWFYDHLTTPFKPNKGPAWFTWAWVTAFAPGTEVVGSIVKVHGRPMTAKVVTVNQLPALQIYADYIFVYAVQQPGVAASRLRIVAQEYATVQFSRGPSGSLEPWIYDFGASYADALCGTTDGLVHPAFPALGPGRVPVSGRRVSPYQLGQRSSRACQAVTGT